MRMTIEHEDGNECLHKVSITQMTEGKLHAMRNALLKHAQFSEVGKDLLVQVERAMKEHGIVIELPVTKAG